MHAATLTGCPLAVQGSLNQPVVWDLQTVGLSMTNAFASRTWLYEGAF